MLRERFNREHGTLSIILSRKIVHSLEECWDPNPEIQPDFSEICKELRFLKAILLIDKYVSTSKACLLDSFMDALHWILYLVSLILFVLLNTNCKPPVWS